MLEGNHDLLPVLLKNSEENRKKYAHLNLGEYLVVYQFTCQIDGEDKKGMYKYLPGGQSTALHNAAFENLEQEQYRMLPLNMEGVIELLLSDQKGEQQNFLNMDLVQARQKVQQEEILSWVVTNERCQYGANVLLRSDIMEQIGNILGEDYFVVPSSVHEVLIIQEQNKEAAEEINQVIDAVNRKEVREQDQLGEYALLYDSQKKCLVSSKNWQPFMLPEKGKGWKIEPAESVSGAKKMKEPVKRTII